MNITPGSEEKIKEAKNKQRAIIVDCDKAIADIKANIKVLQDALAAQTLVKKRAQDILNDLDTDFPDISNIPPTGV